MGVVGTFTGVCTHPLLRRAYDVAQPAPVTPFKRLPPGAGATARAGTRAACTWGFRPASLPSLTKH